MTHPLEEIVEAVAVGIVIVDKDLRVHRWNRWMEHHSGLDRDAACGETLDQLFPTMKAKRLRRKVKTVLHLGNFEFLDARVHRYLLPMRKEDQLTSHFSQMQQSCTLAPVAGPDGSIDRVCISIIDDTHVALAHKALEAANAKLEHISRTDVLTGVANRRAAVETLRNEVRRASRYGSTVSVCIIDVDHFKAVNDTYGHLGGDEVLRVLGRTLGQAVRDCDTVGRYGGEEMVIVMPETPLAGAAGVAERLRRTVEMLDIPFKDTRIQITFSAGVAEFCEGEDENALLDRADAALYRAKASGRNRVKSGDLITGLIHRRAM